MGGVHVFGTMAILLGQEGNRQITLPDLLISPCCSSLCLSVIIERKKFLFESICFIHFSDPIFYYNSTFLSESHSDSSCSLTRFKLH